MLKNPVNEISNYQPELVSLPDFFPSTVAFLGVSAVFIPELCLGKMFVYFETLGEDSGPDIFAGT